MTMIYLVSKCQMVDILLKVINKRIQRIEDMILDLQNEGNVASLVIL